LSARSRSQGPDANAQLIVIGSSAGGIDALSTLVRTIPVDLPAPILLAQHLDPRRPSHLQDILQRNAKLPIVTVDGESRLRPGTIYVVPPNATAEITDHAIRLTAGASHGPNPSIDRLFSSAAQIFGEGLIAVILTGTGSDGASGARDVKALGGTVVIQNPQTASYPGMPESLAPTTVDIVAELEAIGPLLHDLATGAYVPSQPDDERPLTAFLDKLRQESGIDFSTYKRATIMRRLQRRMAATGTTRFRDYVRHVNTHPDEYQRLTSAFLIKVTEFFRDRDLFDHLRSDVVPQIIANARQHDNEIRVWSAGCATGEEAYSLAILFAEALGEELGAFNLRIFATDVDNDAIGFARRGVYPPSAVAELPPDMLERHFATVPGGYEVRKAIRAITVFGQHDLGQRAPFPRIDLALCRNVLIYFTQELQRRALQLFAFSLRDGGYLVLGKAESTTPLPEHFVMAEPRLKIYRRQGDRVLIPPTRFRESLATPPARPAPSRRATWVDALRGARDLRAVGAAERAESLLLRLPVGVVVVDRRYDISSINAAARRNLAIHGPAVGDDFVHLLPPSAAEPVRSLIDTAFGGQPGDAVIDIPVATPTGTESRSIRIRAEYLDGDPDPATDLVIVLAIDGTDDLVVRRKLEDELAAERAERERFAAQIRDVAVTQGQLLDANEQLTTANAELRSANEELLVANEEVQAATEEVETLNEELQATNEELETLNEELQATVEELNTTNDDLQARSVELQDGARSLETERTEADGERRRLIRIVDAMPDAVAILDERDAVVFMNARYRELFEASSATFVGEDGKAVPKSRSPLKVGGTFRLRRGSRTVGPFEARIEPLGEDDGGELRLLVVRSV
jgi:two-component system CheB/CheR fusion protein